MSESIGTLGPPAFLRNEVVRITRASGHEVDAMDDPVPEDVLIGLVGTVHGAEPSADRSHWLLSVVADGDEFLLSTPIPEGNLESLGVMDRWTKAGRERVPLDRSACLPWYDDVLVSIAFDAASEEWAAETERTVVEWARGCVGACNVDSRLMLLFDEHWDLSVYIDAPSGDVLDAFDALSADALQRTTWANRDDDAYLNSEWDRNEAPDGEAFLDPSIERASLMFRRYEGTDRRERRCPPWPSPPSLSEVLEEQGVTTLTGRPGTAVRLVHDASGVAAESSAYPTQSENRDAALQELQAALAERGIQLGLPE